MTGKPNNTEKSLRKQAEMQLRRLANKSLDGDLSDKDMVEIAHELQVHQIELEIQNEELRRAQGELLTSHQRFSDLFHQAPIGYLILDHTGLVKDVNDTFCRMTDHQPGNIKNRMVFELITEKERSWFMARYKALYKKPEKKNIKLDLLTAGGEALPVSLEAVSCIFQDMDSSDADTPQLLLTVSDITERKRAENALQAQTDLLVTVFESSPNILILVDAEGRVEKINRAGSEFADSPQEELIGLLGGDVFQCINSFDGVGCGRNPECGDCPVRTRMMRSLQEGTTLLNEEGSLTVRKDAQEIQMDFLISTVPVKIADATKVLITIVDITERKRADEETRYQAYLLENVSDAIIATTSDFTIESWNRAAEEMYGWKENEVLGKTVEEVLESEFEEPLKDILENFYAQSSWRGEAVQHRKDGTPISVLSSVRLILDADGEFIRAIATNRDITDRKKAEEALRRSELQNRTILRTALDGFWLIDPENGRILDVNDAYCQMSGYSREEILKMNIADFEAIESPEDVLIHSRKIHSKGKDRFESAHKRKDGSIFQVEVSVQNLKDDGGKNFAFIHDITSRKEAEQALRKSAEQYRMLFDEMLSGFALHEIICDEKGKPIDYRFLAVNSAFETLTGLKADDLIGKTVLEVMPSTESFWIERYGKVALEGVTDQFDGFSAIMGKHYEARAFCPEPGKFAVMFHDVTERKRAEENLKKAQHHAKVGSWTWNIKTNVVEWSDEMFDIFGVDKQTFTGSLNNIIEKSIHPDDRARVEESNQSVAYDGKPIPVEYRVIRPDGSICTVWAEAGELIRDEHGEPAFLSGVVQDITDRKQVENELRVTLTKYKTLFNTIPIGVTISDEAGNILESNSVAEKLLGLSSEEQARRSIDGEDWQIVRTDGTVMPPEEFASVRALKEKRLVENVEMGIIKSHDETTWINVTADLLPLDDYGVVIAYNDISERKRAEEELKNLLKEKEILLAEVHHRVKNNLQVVTSLLNLQAEGIDDKRILAVLEESQNRIQSMTLVHEQLYRSHEYAHIDLRVYVDQLVSTLFNLYEVEPDQIQLKLDAKNVNLDLERAIPCGLLLNELITNSLKYAFPQGMKGQINIKIKRSSGSLLLEFSDNGVGLPKHIDFNNTQSLGLQLIYLLTTHDLHGNITIDREKGTKYLIEIPISASEKVD